MESPESVNTETAHGRSATGALWFGVVAGPLAALANEQIEYVLVSWSCGRLDPVTSVLLHAVPVALVLLSLLAAWVAWRHRTHRIRASDDATVEDQDRAGFMALLGIGLGIGSALVIVAQWIPVFYFGPCVHT